jgi:N6-L-threonylcarbamoyladenine synthase
MIILGIESSCDDTSLALVKDDKTIIAVQTLSQLKHQAFGGVVPEIAARAHLEAMPYLFDVLLQKANITIKQIDGIAATIGPGLIGGLIVGAHFGRGLALATDKKFFPINHLEGHALSPRLAFDLPFPYLLLLVSGGHCQILSVNGVAHYTLLGTTRDDAIGECFDKCAKMLGLPYPGGPEIEKLAKLCADPSVARASFPLPLPFAGEAHADFSLSGLKSAFKRLLDQFPSGDIPQKSAAALAFSLQSTIADLILDRLNVALPAFKNLNPNGHHLVVAGGVAANITIRTALEAFAKDHHFSFMAPPLSLCTDNGAMIAWAAHEYHMAGLTLNPDLPCRPRWPLIDMQHVLNQPPLSSSKDQS